MKMVPSENQQEPPQLERPQGVIPRIQRQKKHEEFFDSFTAVDTVMLPITHAERLLRQGLTASTYTNKQVITTTTIPDNELKSLDWETERDIVQLFQPEYHIPTDYWVYGDMDFQDRIHNVESLTEGTEWMYNELRETPTQLIPLIKGYSLEERAICYEMLNRLEIDCVSYYGSQYFGGSSGNGIAKLNEDVRDVVSEFSPKELLLIGLQSEKYVGRLPPEVSAVAGQRWIRKSKLRDVSIPNAREAYRSWQEEVVDGLAYGQATLGSFDTSAGVTA
ncbi:hypothetical protein [Halonotius terrestris]|uniref:hypothetical protein n=1 Tax=Halonotius terrestris TaxID=2487750 RepID=UPI001FE45CB3|nr:hypothetical protein [Halonotius terrestris]